MHYISAPVSVQNSFEADSSLSPSLKKDPNSQLDIGPDDTISTTKANILIPPQGPVINFKTKTHTRMANWDFIAKGVLSPLPVSNMPLSTKKGSTELDGSIRANLKEIAMNLRGQARGGTAPNVSIILDPKNPKKVQLNSSKVSFIESHYVQSLDGNLDETNRRGNRANSLLSSSYYGNTSSLQMDGMRHEDSRVSIIKDFLIRKSVQQPQNFAMRRKSQIRDHSRPESSREMAKQVGPKHHPHHQHDDNLDHLLNSSVSSIKSSQLDTYIDSIEDIETKESHEDVRKKDPRESSPDHMKMVLRRKSMRRKSFVDDISSVNNKNINDKSPMSNKESDISGSSESKFSAKQKRATHHHHGKGSPKMMDKKMATSKVKLKHRIRRKSDVSTYSGGICLKLEKHSDIILPSDFKPKSAAAKILAQHAKARKKTKVAKMLHSRVKIAQMFKKKGNEQSLSSPRLIPRAMSNTPNLEPNISHFGQSHHPSHFLVPPECNDNNHDNSKLSHKNKKEMSLRMIKVKSSGIFQKRPSDLDAKVNLFTPVTLERDSVGKSKFLSPVPRPQSNFNFSETDTRKSQQSSSSNGGGFRDILKIDLKKKSKQQGELKDALKTVLTLNKKAENIFFKPKNVVRVKDLRNKSQTMSRATSKEKLNSSSSTKYLSQKIELWPFMSPTDLNNAMEEKVFGKKEEKDKNLASPLQSPNQKRKYRKKKKVSLSITRSESAPKISSLGISPYAKPVYL